jgi:beta-glucosidase
VDEQAIRERAAELVGQLSVEEKASLTSGRDFWTTEGIERVGLPAITVTDGPHGVRLQQGATDHLGLHEAVPATCFPTASALAATWDLELVREVGVAIAREALEFGVGVVLGPGVNLKRSPLCGRNFEYFSEDPLLSGELAAAFIDGVQSQGVGTSLKHFAANNQESRRMTIDAVVPPRVLRELELASFEIAVTRAQPWTVMCSYNRLNGTYACQHPWLLTDVLKDEWGHEGIVVTDWGAMDDRVTALAAGCELEMPGVNPTSDARIAAAVRAGLLDAAILDAAATRLVAMALRADANRQPDATFDRDEHHALARTVAANAAVLLRNEADALPIRDGDTVAVIGAFADRPRFQGTGSSRISPTRVDSLRSELLAALGEERIVGYAPGYADTEHVDDALLVDAVALAAQADVAVVCVGLPDGYENEGNDRAFLGLPPTHDALVAALAAAHPRVAVVLANGAPVTMPWAADVAAVLEGYLGGQAGGGGLADVLTGAVNPSGRLAETFPRSHDDVPAHRNFPGGPATVEYREGLYVGYRYHDTVGGDVLFPFGHGLSYTSFSYGEPVLDRDTIEVAELAEGGTVQVDVEVTNTGARAGATVVQLYVRDVESAVHRPDRELRAFAKVHLEPGASATATLTLGERAFAFWDTEADDWTVEPGSFELLVGTSSRDVVGRASLTVPGEALPSRDEPAVYRRPSRYLDVDRASFEALLGHPAPPNEPPTRPFDRNTPIGDTASTAFGRILVPIVERRLRASFGDDPANEALVVSMLEEAPLRTLLMGGVTDEQLDTIVDLVNGDWSSGANRVASQLRELLERR